MGKSCGDHNALSQLAQAIGCGCLAPVSSTAWAGETNCALRLIACTCGPRRLTIGMQSSQRMVPQVRSNSSVAEPSHEEEPEITPCLPLQQGNCSTYDCPSGYESSTPHVAAAKNPDESQAIALEHLEGGANISGPLCGARTHC
eukprot:1466219-Amphidinium_carterae.1